jgi:hypothetical protein
MTDGGARVRRTASRAAAAERSVDTRFGVEAVTDARMTGGVLSADAGVRLTRSSDCLAASPAGPVEVAK